MRAVFDTNVLVSALLSGQSTPAQAFFGAMEQGEVLMSAPLANEIDRILHRKKFDRYLSAEQRETFLIALVQSTTLVEITETVQVCRDPRDNMLLELALSGKADVMRSERPYRRAMQDEEVTGFIRKQQGILFDPNLVEAFYNFVRSEAGNPPGEVGRFP